MSHIITADFNGGANPAIDKSAWQYDYGAILVIKGLDLPANVEIHFATTGYGEIAETRVGTSTDGTTTVAIPDRLLEMPERRDYRIYAYIYLTDADSGHTEYKISIYVRARPKPGEQHPDTDEDHPLSDAVQAVSAAAGRAESAAGAAADSAETARTAEESASKDAAAAKEAVEQTAEDAKQVAADREAVEQARDHVDKVVADFDQYAEDTETAAIAEIRSAADAAKEAGVNAIEDAETKSLEAVQQAKSAGVKAVDDTKTAGVKAVKDAQITAETAITKAQATGVSAIEEAVETGKQNFVTDTTLNIEGRAADAKAVGKQIGVLKDDLRQLSDEITKIPSGKDGVDGQDGVTPTIGDNGNWYLGDTDTGKPSRGEAGPQGPAGADGKDGVDGQPGADGSPGADGKSAYQYAQDGGYTGTEEEFAEKLAQGQLTGTTGNLMPTQVYNAVSAGIPVKVQYVDSTYGLLSFTAFNIAESLNVIVSQTIVCYNGMYILAELNGIKSNNTWGTAFTTLAEKTDIPTALHNPNALTFTGAVTGSYDGSAAMTVSIPSAVTDDHINSLIDTKLGVIENGSY